MRQKPERNEPRRIAKPQRANGNSQDDFKIGPYPLVCPKRLGSQNLTRTTS